MYGPAPSPQPIQDSPSGIRPEPDDPAYRQAIVHGTPLPDVDPNIAIWAGCSVRYYRHSVPTLPQPRNFTFAKPVGTS